MNPPSPLPRWPTQLFGRMNAIETFVVGCAQPPTGAEISRAFAGTVKEELEIALQTLVGLDRLALIDSRYHWLG